MQTVETLALRIYGGPLGAGLNPQALVAVGSIPDNFRPMPPTIVDESQSWMITHAQGYTSYAMYSKDGIFAADGLPGQLMIYLFLPTMKRLADGKTALGLFDSIYDNFCIQNMVGGHLPVTEVDSSPYTMLLKRYRLEDRPMQLPVMSGHEPAAYCVENRAQLDALMRHSRYNELQGVGRLELGLHCRSTIMLNVKGATPKRTPSTPPPVTPKVTPLTPNVNPAPSAPASVPPKPAALAPKNGSSVGKNILKGLGIFFGGLLLLFVIIFLIGFFTDKKEDLSDAEQDAKDEYVDSTEIEEVEEASIQPSSVTDASFHNSVLSDYTYTGPVDSEGLPHGTGKARFKNGDIYDGCFTHGVFSGKATYTYKDGTKFEGTFHQNKFDQGKLIFTDGSYFQGHFKDFQPDESRGQWH